MVPPRRTAKGWQRYAVMMRSCSSMASSIPMATASCGRGATRKMRGEEGPGQSRAHQRGRQASPDKPASTLPSLSKAGWLGCTRAGARPHLSDGKVAETTDELGLVKRVGGLLHLAHPGHVGVHLEKLVLRDLDIERGRVATVAVEPEQAEKRRRTKGRHGSGDRKL